MATVAAGSFCRSRAVAGAPVATAPVTSQVATSPEARRTGSPPAWAGAVVAVLTASVAATSVTAATARPTRPLRGEIRGTGPYSTLPSPIPLARRRKAGAAGHRGFRWARETGANHQQAAVDGQVWYTASPGCLW